MRLIVTLHRWALVDIELILMQRLDRDGDTELDDVDRDPIPFGFGISDD